MLRHFRTRVGHTNVFVTLEGMTVPPLVGDSAIRPDNITNLTLGVLQEGVVASDDGNDAIVSRVNSGDSTGFQLRISPVDKFCGLTGLTLRLS